MTIQKKSLISKLNTTQKAIVASTPTQENPTVSAPVSARLDLRKKAEMRLKADLRMRADMRKKS